MNKDKTSIARRIFVLMLLTGLVCFVAFETVSFLGLYGAQTKALKNSEEMGKYAAEFAENVADKEAKKRFTLFAKEKAKHIEIEMARLKEDTELLAKEMTYILTHREFYLPRRLPVGGEAPIASGEPYIFFLHSARESGRMSEILHDAEIASNAEDILSLWVHSYDNGHEMTCFYASKDGYIISADLMPQDTEPVKFYEEWFSPSFDPRERPWYKEVKTTGKTIFTNIYVGIEGYHAISCVAPYYDENGFAGMACISNNIVSLYRQIVESGLGDENRVNFILNNKGEVILSSEKEGLFAASESQFDLRKSTEPDLAEKATSMTQGKSDVAQVTVDGKEYYLAYAPMPSIGWSFGALIEKEQVTQSAQDAREHLLSRAKDFSASLQKFFYSNLVLTAASLLALAIIFFFLSRKVSARFVKPILALSDGVKEIAAGNLDKKLYIQTGDEIEDLALHFNSMTDELKKYIENLSRVTAERERVQTELSIATAIQAGMLPKNFPQHGAFDIYATMHPARNVGGDFYDFYFLDENHLAITIADVSGKGVGAAIFMSRSMTILKNFATMMDNPNNPADVLYRANNLLCQGNKEDMFVTVFMGILDMRTGDFIYANGGHNPPLLRNSDAKSCEYLPMADSCMLGMIKNIPFTNRQLTLKFGNMLFLYTDGVTEAMNGNGELFSEERLLKIMNAVPNNATAKEILDIVRAAVQTYSGGAEQSDDITMLGLRYL